MFFLFCFVLQKTKSKCVDKGLANIWHPFGKKRISSRLVWSCSCECLGLISVLIMRGHLTRWCHLQKCGPLLCAPHISSYVSFFLVFEVYFSDAVKLFFLNYYNSDAIEATWTEFSCIEKRCNVDTSHVPIDRLTRNSLL